MGKIIREAEFEDVHEYRMHYNRVVDGREKSHGYAFDCDKDGNLGTPEYEAARENLAQCETGFDYDGTPLRARLMDFSRSIYHPPLLRCDCGENVLLEGFTNTCSCGADYNQSGQRLGPRVYWGEETGESLGDVLRIR